MGSAIYAQAQAEQQAAAQEGAAAGSTEDGAPQGDDVVDAEIVDEGPSDTREGGAA
jgi:hypothetical protein